jgi:hypothetical protein
MNHIKKGKVKDETMLRISNDFMAFDIPGRPMEPGSWNRD